MFSAGDQVGRRKADGDAYGHAAKCAGAKLKQHAAEGKSAAGDQAEQGQCCDGGHRVVEGGFGYDGLFEALADAHGFKERHQHGRVGGSDDGAKEQAGQQVQMKDAACGEARDGRGGHDANGGQEQHREFDFVQDFQVDLPAAVVQDVGGAKGQDQLVRGGIGADVNQVEGRWADQDASEDVHDDVWHMNEFAEL